MSLKSKVTNKQLEINTLINKRHVGSKNHLIRVLLFLLNHIIFTLISDSSLSNAFFLSN